MRVPSETSRFSGWARCWCSCLASSLASSTYGRREHCNGIDCSGRASDRFVCARIAGRLGRDSPRLPGQLGTRQFLVANAVWDGVLRDRVHGDGGQRLRPRALRDGAHELLPATGGRSRWPPRSEEHTSELQSLTHLVCRLLLEKKKNLNRGGEDAGLFFTRFSVANASMPAPRAHLRRRQPRFG